MTKIIATHIRNIDEAIIGIFIDIPLEYIVYYLHGHDEYVMKNRQDISR